MPDDFTNRGEHTHEEIIAAAHSLFLQNGYHGTSMRQIARSAGIALGSIYNHFSGKEEIFKAIILEHHPLFDILLGMNAAQGETTEALVRDAAHRMVNALGERKDFLNLMFIELVEFKGQHVPALFELFFPQLQEFSRHLVSKPGQLRPIPMPVILRAFVGLFFSYVITEIVMGQQMPAEMRENSLDSMVDIYLHGILVDGEV